MVVGEEKMSVRKRLSKSSNHAEEEEEGQRDCAEESQEAPSNGEAFTFSEVIYWNREQIQCSWTRITISLALNSPLQYPCLENPMDGGAW